MPRICFCPGCKTGYTTNRNKLKKEGKKVPPLFLPPKDPYLFEMWKKAIPRADRMLNPKDLVCELHFKKEDILSHYETKLRNGYIHRFLRGRKALKPGVIPSIFPNVPGHSTFQDNRATKLKEKPIKRYKAGKKKDSSHQTGKENVLMEVIVVQPLPENFAAAQPCHLKENQNVKTTSSSVPTLEKHARPELEAPASCSFFDTITENLRQNAFETIITESPSADKLMKNYQEQNSSITNIAESFGLDAQTDNYSIQNSTDKAINVSFVSDIQTKNYSKQNSSNTTIVESSVPDALTKNYSSQCSIEKTMSKSSVADILIENYSKQNSTDKTIIESYVPDTQTIGDGINTASSVPDILSKNHSEHNSSDKIMTEASVPDALADNSICEVIMTEYSSDDIHPNNFSDQSNDNATLTELIAPKTAVSDADQNICDKIRAKINKIFLESEVKTQVSFDFIKANIDMFETADSWWRVNSFHNFIAFSRWNSDFVVERRIVITKDLAVKVFLMDRETTIGQDMKQFSINDLAKLIYRVENLTLCSGIDKKDRNCSGFLQSVFMCKRYNLCLNCIQWRKEETKKLIKQIKVSPNCVELLNFNLIT